MLEKQNAGIEFTSSGFEQTDSLPRTENNTAITAKIEKSASVIDNLKTSNEDNAFLVTIPPTNHKEMIKHVFHIIRVYKAKHNQEFTEIQMKTVFDALCLKTFSELIEYGILFDSSHTNKFQQDAVKKAFKKRLIEANFKNSLPKIQMWSKCYERPRRSNSAKAFRVPHSPKKLLSVGFSNTNTIHVF